MSQHFTVYRHFEELRRDFPQENFTLKIKVPNIVDPCVIIKEMKDQFDNIISIDIWWGDS